MRKRVFALVLAFSMLFTTMPIISYGNSNVITGFKELDEQFYTFTGTPTEAELIQNFPDKIQVITEDGIKSVSVSWTSNGTYDRFNYYAFVFEPQIEGYEIEAEIPYLIVFRDEEGVDIPVDEAEDNLIEDVASAVGLYAYAANKDDIVFDFLTKNMGLNVAVACGAIANLYKESGLLSNNVENTFTNKTGMTDEEYTSKINSGEYTKDQFCNDAAGYGLCQWTYWSRKEALYDFAVSYCKEKGLKFDIGNLDMQLEYFKKEISGYSSVQSTFSKVPNLEIGTFLSAWIMCSDFEKPAGADTPLKRAQFALTAYWDERGSSKSDFDNNTYLAICGFTYPTKIAGGISCKGRVVSNKGISTVTAKITDSKGKAFCSYTANYSNKETKPFSYSLAGKVDDNMSFTKLASEGKKGETYTYSVEAVDVNGRTIRFDKNFTIQSSSSTNFDTVVIELSKMKLSNETYPGTLNKGDTFEGAGLIESNYNIMQVNVGVKDSAGKTVLMKETVKPNAKSYDISDLTKKVDIYTLKGGTYTYYIWAKDEDRSKTLLSKQFKVDSKTISNFNYPVSIAKGSSFDVKGKVKSDLKITQVYVRVLNSSGKAVTKKTVSPNATSYQISNLSDYIKFSKLAKGKYTYKVRVTDAIGKKEIVSEQFEVYTPSTLKGEKIAYPSSLKLGKGFTLSGKVKSNYYLKTVTVSILNSKGKAVQTKKMDISDKKYKSYKLANFDGDIKFGTLKKGTYYYKVSAKDEKKSKQLLKKKFTVK